MILDNSGDPYVPALRGGHAAPPIVGEWHRKNSTLNLNADGSFDETTIERRSGIFLQKAENGRIEWASADARGGVEWSVLIEHKHLRVSAGGIARRYHYVPPSFNVDL